MKNILVKTAFVGNGIFKYFRLDEGDVVTDVLLNLIGFNDRMINNMYAFKMLEDSELPHTTLLIYSKYILYIRNI